MSARQYDPISSYLTVRKVNVTHLCNLLVLLISFFPAAGLAAQSADRTENRPDDLVDLQPGIIVEKVANNSEGEKADLQPGDLLLRWVRGGARGNLVSPFDLSNVETEQAPLGVVTLEGRRGTAERSWNLGPDTWGIQLRPNFQGAMLGFYQEGQELAKADKLAEAATRWRRAAGVAQSPSSSQAAWLPSWFLSRAAAAFTDARQWGEADSVYQDAVGKAAGIGSGISPILLYAWATTFVQRSDWTNAGKYYQQSAAEGQQSNRDSLTVAMSLDGLGESARKRGDLAKAEKYHQQALDIRQKLAPGSLPVASTFNGLGAVAWDRGDLTKAEEYYLQALDVRQKLTPGSLAVSVSFINLGNVALKLGNVSKAEEHYGQALEIRQKLDPGSLYVAAILNNLGVLAQTLGDLTKADEYQYQALAIDQKLAPTSFSVGVSFNNLGDVAMDRGDAAKAEEYFRQALEMFNIVAPNSPVVANIVDNLGEAARDRGDLAKAEEYHRQALEMRQKIAPGSGDVAMSLNNLGEVARDRGELAKAEEYIRQAVVIQLKVAPGSLTLARFVNNLGEMARDRGDVAQAEEYYSQALAISEKLAPGSATHAETLAGLAGVARGKQKRASAAKLYEQALNALESQTARLGGTEEVRSAFRARHATYYKDYIDLLITNRQPELAFQVLERSRARSLLEMLAEAHVDIRKGVEPMLLEQERSLRGDIAAKTNRRISLLAEKHTEEQLAAVTQQIGRLHGRYDEVEAQIRATSPSYAALTQPQPLTVAQVQHELLDHPETILLEYSLGEERSFLFAVTSTSVNVYELPKGAEVEQASRTVYELLTERNRYIQEEGRPARLARLTNAETRLPQELTKLSRMVLGPVAGQLGGKRLLIVSDGALQYIPFAILLSPSRSDSPLVLDHEIVSLPSASVTAMLRAPEAGRRIPAKTVAVVADPVFSEHDPRVFLPKGKPKLVPAGGNDKPLGPLPDDRLTRSARDVGILSFPRLAFSRQEADAIISVTPKGQGLKALDFEASRQTVTSPSLAQYRIVHFATHGLLDNEHPDLSGLVFSLVDERGKPQNGFVSLEDIFNLELPADLIVLSACETGLGKEVRGEGLVGLTRGFLYAGARRVVASLWSVDDAATAELMRRFYQGALNDGLSPPAALRQAQIEMWKQKRWRQPYHWGAFVLQGDWKPLSR